MNDKLLTIVVPTYNRADCLELLLRTLVHELSDLESRVNVIVGDNASTDRTPEVITEFVARWPGTILLRHEENVGPEENFFRCLEHVESKYFWIIGDDDVPRAGVVHYLLDVLAVESPDLVYLNSDWQPRIVDNEPHDPVRSLNIQTLDRLSFARKVHVWTTFISGMVVNWERYLETNDIAGIRRFAGTSLPQLVWVLENLKWGKKFIAIPDKCVLATAGNTGGYAVFEVFGVNFARICGEIFGKNDRIARSMIFRNIVMFMPGLIWNVRFSNIGKFEKSSKSFKPLRRMLGGYLFFWILIVPTLLLEKYPARIFSLISALSGKLIRVIDQHRETRS